MTVILSPAPDWLEDSYWLQDYAWLDGNVAEEAFIGSQARFLITNARETGAQSQFKITDFDAYGAQAQGVITKDFDLGGQLLGVITKANGIASQTRFEITTENAHAAQSQWVITSVENTGAQTQLVLTKDDGTGAQSQLVITTDFDLGSQSQFVITKTDETGAQTTFTITDSFEAGAQSLFTITKDYDLGARLQGIITKTKEVGAESRLVITTTSDIGAEIIKRITVDYDLGGQTQGVITKPKPVASRFRPVRRLQVGAQARFVLYNTKRLRILREFPSRGVTGLNWTATSTQPGDFSVYNLNTDVVEQVWRTATGVKSATITCDTEVVQGIFNDTLGIINHNLTLGAKVTMQAADEPTFSPVDFEQELLVERNNIYWLSPELPTSRYRYWRFVIVDNGNPQNFLSVGTIVFGSSIVFSLDECFNDTLRFKITQYADQVQTEGFTNVKNDRGKKRSFTLDFTSLSYSGPNFSRLRNLFETAGTVLKCLWIPTPDKPSRFAVFGKLTEIPQEEHRVLGPDSDYINLTVNVDESQ